MIGRLRSVAGLSAGLRRLVECGGAVPARQEAMADSARCALTWSPAALAGLFCRAEMNAGRAQFSKYDYCQF